MNGRRIGLIGAMFIVAAAGCSSEDVTVNEPAAASSAATPTSVTTAGTSPAVTTAIAPPSTSTTSAGGSNCLATELSVSLGASSGAAGSTELPIVFANIGNRTCMLDGYPGVSYLASPGGAQVGQAATRAGSGASPVAVAPGNSATALVKATVVANYPPDQCQPTPVEGLNVYSPNTTEAVYLPYATTGCATSDPSTTQLAVQPVVAD